LFIGDPAFYKADKEGNVEQDLSKRLGALISSGEEMKIETEGFGDELQDHEYNVSTIKTQKLKSAYYNDLLEIHSEYVGEEQAKKNLKPYTEIEQADGQTFITPELYRSIAIRIGEWGDAQEQAFNLLQSKDELNLE